MRAVKIDPITRTVTEINLKKNPNSTLEELYSIIGCDLVELVQIDRDMVMVVDESVFAQGYAPTKEGKCKNVKGVFTFIGWGTVQFFPETNHLRQGQIVWTTVHKNARGSYGKSIKDTELTPVVLTLVQSEDAMDRVRGKNCAKSKKRRQPDCAVKLTLKTVV